MSSSTSSSRRQLAVFGLVFALVLALIAAASEWLVRDQVLPQDDFRAHVRHVKASTAKDTAFGDSHVARGFAPPAPFANLAYPSEGVPHMAWKVRAYYKNRKPGRVILSADPHLFSPYRLAVPLGDYPSGFDGGLQGPAIFNPYFRSQLFAYWTAFVESGGRLRSTIERTANGALLSPGDLSRADPRRRLYETRFRVRVHRVVDGARLEKSFDEYRRLVKWLTDAGARVCLALFPLSPDYRRAYATVARPAWREARSRLIGRMKELAAATGARFVDHRAAVSAPRDFRDPDHLNGPAARLYGPRLVRDCFGD